MVKNIFSGTVLPDMSPYPTVVIVVVVKYIDVMYNSLLSIDILSSASSQLDVKKY